MSLQDMETLMIELSDIRGQIDDLKSEEKKLSEAKEKVEAKILEELKAVGNDSYKSTHGTAYIATSLSYKMPKDQTERERLFAYINEKGTDVYNNLITINSQTFNAWCKAETDAAKEAGVFPFEIPGVEDPVSYEQLRFRRN